MNWKRAAAAATVMLLVGCSATPDEVLDSRDVEREIAASLEEKAGGPVEVTCPDEMPVEAGKIIDCVADDGVDRLIVRVTQDDAEGHYRYELTSQRA